MDLHRIGHEAARLMPLVYDVLDRYPFQVRQVSHLATHSNVMYRVITTDGVQRVLRVGRPSANTRAQIEYEVAWLAALNRDTDLDVVSPIPTGYGALVVEARDEESGQALPCVLFSWVPGEPLGDGAGSFGYRMLGRMCAALQEHGRGWQPPKPEGMRRWNRVFYYEDDPIVIDDHRLDHLFGWGRRRLVECAVELAEKVIESAWATEYPQVVHGDLHEWNVHLVRSRLIAFDFEDMMIATPSQDLSISLYSSRTSPRRQEIRRAFRQGFEEIAPWPMADDEQLDGFHAARQVMLMNYAARALPMGEAEDYLEKVTPWLQRYVDHYGG